MSTTHSTVFAQAGVYAGWPANHGAWQWDDEFLVGLIRGRHIGRGEPGDGDHHSVQTDSLEKALARSLDGGQTWTVEVPNVDFECRSEDLKPSAPFQLGDSIIRVCGNYDHGGELCAAEGGFYVSRDRGRVWDGPHGFEGINVPPPAWNTSRTCVIDDLVFLTYADRHAWGSDFVLCFQHRGDGRFAYVSTVWQDDGRAVMPAVARVGGRLVVVARRRQGSNHWIDAFGSDDEAKTWRHLSLVADTEVKNGNPPALVESNGILWCAYGDRRACEIRVRSSRDGEKWSLPTTLRSGDSSDIGYPRLFARADGKLVCVYYWSDKGEAQRIEATTFDPV